MSKELPYFQFEPAQYLSGDIVLCSFASQGVFMRLMALYWQRDCNLTLYKAQRLLDEELLNELIDEDIIKLEGHNDDIIISFLDKQYELISKRKKRLSDAGKKGAKAKQNKPPLSEVKATLKQPDKIREDKIREKEIIGDKKKVDNNKPKGYGDAEINEVIDYLKEKLGGISLDGTVKDNRNMCNHLINKIKKDYPDKNAVESIKVLIDHGLNDKFHGKNITSIPYIYRNLTKIINSIKNGKAKSTTSADIDAIIAREMGSGNN